MKRTNKILSLAMAMVLAIISVVCISADDVYNIIADDINITFFTCEIGNYEELIPMRAAGCVDYSDILSGKPVVPDGYTRVRNDVASVKSDYFIGFVEYKYGSYRANEWKKHMETWENDDGDTFECHYWQGPNGVTYYHN